MAGETVIFPSLFREISGNVKRFVAATPDFPPIDMEEASGYDSSAGGKALFPGLAFLKKLL